MTFASIIEKIPNPLCEVGVLSGRFLEQTQLLIECLHRPLGCKGRFLSTICASDLVFRAQTSHQLRQSLAVCGGEEGPMMISLAIIFYEVGEVLFEEGKKYSGGTGLEEQRIGEYVFGASFGSGANHRFQIFGGIGNPWNHRRAAHSDPQARLAQVANRVHSEIGARRSWLKNASQIHVQGRDRDVNRQLVGLGYLLQQIEIAHDQV